MNLIGLKKTDEIEKKSANKTGSYTIASLNLDTLNWEMISSENIFSKVSNRFNKMLFYICDAIKSLKLILAYKYSNNLLKKT